MIQQLRDILRPTTVKCDEGADPMAPFDPTYFLINLSYPED